MTVKKLNSCRNYWRNANQKYSKTQNDLGNTLFCMLQYMLCDLAIMLMELLVYDVDVNWRYE